MSKFLALATAMLIAASAANAATIVNLSASSTTPNAGPNSGTYTPNPVYETLGAGTYSVGVIGTASGGAYDAYSVYAPTSSNAAYTDGNWSFSQNVSAGVSQTEYSTNRFDTSAAALSYYGSLSPLTFTLTGTTNVAFYLDDTAFPYFGDDSGGVSLAINQVAVPEPASLALLGVAFAGIGMVRRRNKNTTATA